MSNTFIIHGTDGNPDENWIPWLKGQLEQEGYEVVVPRFPTPEEQSLEAWMEAFEPYKQKITDETIFVGHSLGPAFILHLLEAHKAKALVSVSGFLGELGNEHFDTLNKTFMKDFDWDTIRANTKSFAVLHGDNDPYVPVEKAQELAKHLGTKVELIPDGGHLNTSAGYTTFELLLSKVLEV